MDKQKASTDAMGAMTVRNNQWSGWRGGRPPFVSWLSWLSDGG